MPLESEAIVKRSDADAKPRDYSSPIPHLDFAKPEGDPGLLGPGSMGWKVSANPIVSAVGGIAAVILELAEKHVRAGVWDHSTFKVDPIRRMERTGMAAAAVTYGPAKMAQQTFDRVTRMHQRVTGTTHDGDNYRAMDPKLLTWVHVTAAWGFLNAYKRYANPNLSREDEDRYYREGEIIGKGFGAEWVPTSAAEMDVYMTEMTPKLYANDTVQEFLELVRNATPLGQAGKPIQRLITQAAIDLLPKHLQEQCGVAVSAAARPMVRPAVRALANTGGFAMRFASTSPSHQACRRMGVSTDCLR
ncbi:MAG: oxygenase MpaB family protein [Parvibaculum sp.]|uniref:oxygenase MpaB family protein n=1 Tax=Parvibaculum sp. TaxID=2024848 RepID=UPI00271D4452|nr:oxygenase MpaB family protein [Parvibaculum sp.]MDO8838935.1 oxygenase MpaB family protein [Parvibaculum sp.]